MKIFTADNMRMIDHKTISNGYVSGEILMERAGKGAVREILRYAALISENFSKRFLIVCGKGNNGGDGLVIAQELHSQGKMVQIISLIPKENYRDAAQHFAQKLNKQIPYQLWDEFKGFQQGDFIVDCLLGTGLTSQLKEPYIKIIEEINSSFCPVIAIDIPSGLDGNDGTISTVAVKADLTVTIGFPKSGFFENDGPAHIGRLKCVDIGFPEEVFSQIPNQGEIICEQELAKFFPRREHTVHKYQCGSVLVIGGSKNYSGAPFLSALAAAKSGAGMVSVVFPESISAQTPLGLIKIPLTATNLGTFGEISANEMTEYLNKKDVIIIGPGMTGDETEMAILEQIVQANIPLIIDAGALTLVAHKPNLLNRNGTTILTPHSGELARLLAATKCSTPFELANKYNCFIVKKGQFSETISPSGKVLKNSTGCAALAVAGSGDVLAGIISAIFAWSKVPEIEKIAAAVALHGLCGEYSLNGVYGSTADDLLVTIPLVLKDLTPFF